MDWYDVSHLAAVSVHAGPDGGHHQGGRDDEERQRGRGEGHQRVVQRRPELSRAWGGAVIRGGA